MSCTLDPTRRSESPSPEVCTYSPNLRLNACACMQGIWALPTQPACTHTTHTPPPRVAVQGSSPEKLSLSVEKPDHLEESSRVGVPDGWNSFWKRDVRKRPRILFLIMPPPPPSHRDSSILCGEEQFPRGVHAYTPLFAPNSFPPNRAELDDEREEQKGVRSYLSYQGTCLLPR